MSLLAPRNSNTRAHSSCERNVENETFRKTSSPICSTPAPNIELTGAPGRLKPKQRWNIILFSGRQAVGVEGWFTEWDSMFGPSREPASDVWTNRADLEPICIQTRLYWCSSIHDIYRKRVNSMECIGRKGRRFLEEGQKTGYDI